jgi:hypothetical protein
MMRACDNPTTVVAVAKISTQNARKDAIEASGQCDERILAVSAFRRRQ